MFDAFGQYRQQVTDGPLCIVEVKIPPRPVSLPRNKQCLYSGISSLLDFVSLPTYPIENTNNAKKNAPSHSKPEQVRAIGATAASTQIVKTTTRETEAAFFISRSMRPCCQERRSYVKVIIAEMFALANVNVRAGPITQTEKLTTIAIGAPVAVVGKTGDWFQVALANGGVGYILGRYLGDAAQPQPPATETGLNPGDVFRECDVCPEMVVIPAGRFTMGSPAGEEGRYDDEGPQHTVAISRPFAVGRFEVTRSEFAAFVTAARHSMTGGCWVYDGEWNKEASRNWASPGFSQTDRDPVVCVNWADAQAYIDWLNSRAARQVAGAGGFGAGGGPYRLLTEAEWEYAARGGTTTARFWGDSPDLACRYGNVADQTARERFTGWTVHNCRDGVYTRRLSAVFWPTDLAFTICWGMCGNGWRTAGMVTTMARLLPARHG